MARRSPRPRNRPRPRRLARIPVTAIALTAVAITAAVALAGCGSAATAGAADGLQIVAAENFWGSIAAQLAGDRGHVHSIIVNPAQDPHSYEPTAADARTLAGAQLAIVNGVDYDPWAPRLLAADADGGRAVLTVGKLLHLADGDNPHRWYSPADVEQVADAITAELKRLDPGDGSYFVARRRDLETRGLARYHQLIAQIKQRYAGLPVGASESIFALQAPALGLRLITPASFMKAISEGTDVSARDTITAQRQITSHEIKVWIFNSQNDTPQIAHLNELARQQGIPVATVTETLTPATDSFEQWQVTQLEAIEQALRQAQGR